MSIGFSEYGFYYSSLEKNFKSCIADKNGNQLTDFIYDDVSCFENGFATVRKEGKSGLVNEKGEEVIPCIYYFDFDINVKDQDFIPVRKNNKYGFVDINGNIKIPLVWSDANNFSSDLARVSKNCKYGFINKKGGEVIPCIYNDARDFVNEFACVFKKDKMFVINKKNEIIFSCNEENNFYESTIYPSGILKAKKNEKHSFLLNIISKEVIYDDLEKVDLYEYLDLYRYLDINSKDETLEFDEFNFFIKNDDLIIIDKNGMFIKTEDIESNSKLKKYLQAEVFVVPIKIDDKEKYFLFDKKLKKISNTLYDFLDVNYDFITFVSKKNYVKNYRKKGVLDKNGKEILKEEYTILKVYKNKIIAKNGRYGVFDINGKIILKLKYKEIIYIADNEYFLNYKDTWFLLSNGLSKVLKIDSIEDLSDYDGITNIFIAKKNNKYFFIDGDGKLIINETFEEIKMKVNRDDYFHSNKNGLIEFFIVKKNDKYYVLDIYLKYTSKSYYDEIHYDCFCSRGGFYKTKKDNKYGFINKNGEEIAPCIYDLVKDFIYGISIVTKNGEFSFINEKGKECLKFGEYQSLSVFEHNSFVLAKKNDKYGLLNKFGETIIPFVYDQIYPSYDDNYKIKVRIENKYGFVDENPEKNIPIIYDNVYNFSQGLSAVKTVSKWGFINTKNQIVIPSFYDDVNPFHWDLASVKIGDKWGVIDLEGNTIIPFEYDDITDMIDNDTFYVNKNNEWFYINLCNERV
ncbi:MAG: WG repeat-containing protein [Candidatus Sericytochromatia bacterium]